MNADFSILNTGFSSLFLLPCSPQFVAEEQRRFDSEVAEVERWWQSERFSLTKRPYSAQEVVRLRESLPKSYTSGLQAKKVPASGEPQKSAVFLLKNKIRDEQTQSA